MSMKALARFRRLILDVLSIGPVKVLFSMRLGSKLVTVAEQEIILGPIPSGTSAGRLGVELPPTLFLPKKSSSKVK